MKNRFVRVYFDDDCVVQRKRPVMTADAFKDAMERGRAAGMSEYLVKPLEPDKIFEALRKL